MCKPLPFVFGAILLALLPVLSAQSVSTLAASTNYQTTYLPDVTTGETPMGVAVNSAGEVIGQGTNGIHGAADAFYWTRRSGMVDLSIETGKQDYSLMVNNVNSSGTIAATQGLGMLYPFAEIWSSFGGLENIGTLYGYDTRASGINDSGQVVGSSAASDAVTAPNYAFLWTASGGMRNLGFEVECFSLVINNQGQVAGILANGDVFLWTQKGGVEDLGFAGYGGAINDNGTIVGALANGHAFRWTASRGMQDLGVLSGFTGSSAASVNDHEQIVGYLLNYPNYTPMVWTQKHGMQLLSNYATVPIGNWQATAINDAGQIVLAQAVGDATRFLTPLMSVSLTSSPNPSTDGQTITFKATVTSIQGAPPKGESISFQIGKTVLGAAKLSGGSATFSTSKLSVGTHDITAVYPGDVNYFSANSNLVQQVVNK